MNRKNLVALLLAFCVGVFALVTATSVGAGEAKHDSKPHWGYSGDAGPEHWGHLAGYETCLSGVTQSPIDIRDTAAADLKPIEFAYGKVSEFEIENNGHTIVVKGKGKNTIKVNGSEYELIQFHFHAPSEHTVTGKSYPVELHLVHKNAEGKLAVIGVMIESGKENKAYSAVFGNLPAKSGAEKKVKKGYSTIDLLPSDKGYVTYAGSLTTPPCSEGVTWLVLKTPVALSAAQIKKYTAIYSGNNRPVQPLNNRTVNQTK